MEEKDKGNDFEGKIGQVMDELEKRGFMREDDRERKLEEGKVLAKEEGSLKVVDKERVVGDGESKRDVEGKVRNMENKEGTMKEKGRVMEIEEGRMEEEEKGRAKEEEEANGVSRKMKKRKVKALGRVIEDKLGRLQTEGATSQNRKIIHSRTLLKSLSSKNDIKLEEKKV
uniref:Uncharacterized protein n=1 Tax=Meloidogyne enterolobii TaxID=390850 RepID=A0A6V7X3L9_MELEN|nr:unnamed protein product [Meloidogyne enterolobii]